MNSIEQSLTVPCADTSKLIGYRLGVAICDRTISHINDDRWIAGGKVMNPFFSKCDRSAQSGTHRRAASGLRLDPDREIYHVFDYRAGLIDLRLPTLLI